MQSKRQKGLWQDTQGVVVILWALMLPVLIGFVGLGVLIGLQYLTQSKLQTAADSAAMATSYYHEMSARALHSLSALSFRVNGFDESSQPVIIVNNPPASGMYSHTTDAVEIIAILPQNILYRALTGQTQGGMRVRAVGIGGHVVE